MSDREQERILLVDDEELNLEILTEFLSENNYCVVPFTSGESALEFLHVDPSFDLVILDRMMPKMCGLELLQRIKREKSIKNIPVIFQTAMGAEEAIIEGIRNGAYYYLTKPFGRETLLAVVESALHIYRLTNRAKELLPTSCGAFSLMVSGEFIFRNLDEARLLAAMVSHYALRGEETLKGVGELLFNAIEHGNLGITTEEKGQLLMAGRWQEEVARRLELAENRGKYATMRLTKKGDELEIKISDMGNGFEWSEFMELTVDRATKPNGRGIVMATHSLKSLSYEEGGKSVRCRIDLAKV